MFLINITFALCIIGTIFLAIGIDIKNKIVRNIGIAILYNMGTNIFLGEISYITKALVAVLQLGVTTDFSIFLYHAYENKKNLCHHCRCTACGPLWLNHCLCPVRQSGCGLHVQSIHLLHRDHTDYSL